MDEAFDRTMREWHRQYQPFTLKAYCERMGWQYPLPTPGTPEGQKFADQMFAEGRARTEEQPKPADLIRQSWRFASKEELLSECDRLYSMLAAERAMTRALQERLEGHPR